MGSNATGWKYFFVLDIAKNENPCNMRTKNILKLSMLWRIFTNPCFKRMLFDWKSHGFLYQPIKSSNNGEKFLSSLIFWCNSPTIGDNGHIHQVSYSSRKNCTLLLIKMILNFESIWPVCIHSHRENPPICLHIRREMSSHLHDLTGTRENRPICMHIHLKNIPKRKWH